MEFSNSFSRSCLSKLQKMTCENTPEDYGPLLEAMCNWGKARDVCELLVEWLDAALNQGQGQPATPGTAKVVSL